MSNNCGEYTLDDLLAVIAIPVSDYSLGTLSWQLKPTIPNTSISPPYTNAIVIGGIRPRDKDNNALAIKGLIPIKKETGKANDSEGDSTAGRLHTVSVSLEADDRDGSVWELLLALERTPSHLLLTFRGGQQAFVSATQDTYTCEVERDGAKTSVSFKIYNLMGIQLITT